MKRLGIGIAVVLAGAAALAAPALPPLEAYLGSEGCKACHPAKHEGWKRTYHSAPVQDARQNPGAILGDFSEPGLGFTREDVEHTVGRHWNQRYLKTIGDEQYVLPKLWSVASQRWEPYNVWGWKKMPYRVYCIGCHATRYDPETRTMAEYTVGCEACHGPGRAHAEAGGAAAIVNPARLGEEGQALLCASCHVRGADPSGVYRFPVGYVPGRNLEDHYVPEKPLEGEGRRAALLREFRAWQDRLRNGSAECEVCGLYGDKARKAPATVTEYCMGCHKFGDQYPRHTRHAATVALECVDCHLRIEVETEPEDVHSLGFFQVHNRTCYDRTFGRACGACHGAFDQARVDAVLTGWKGARAGVHD